MVASSRAFVLAAEHNPNSSGLLPGFYGMHLHMQASLAYAILINPQNMVQIKVTIPEGWRLSQIVACLGAKSGIGLGAYQKVLKSPAQLHLPGYANGKPEGYLFPATYDGAAARDRTRRADRHGAAFPAGGGRRQPAHRRQAGAPDRGAGGGHGQPAPGRRRPGSPTTRRSPG